MAWLSLTTMNKNANKFIFKLATFLFISEILCWIFVHIQFKWEFKVVVKFVSCVGLYIVLESLQSENQNIWHFLYVSALYCFHFLLKLRTKIFVLAIQCLGLYQICQCLIKVFLSLDVYCQTVKMFFICLHKDLVCLWIINSNFITKSSPKNFINLITASFQFNRLKEIKQKLCGILLNMKVYWFSIEIDVLYKILRIDKVFNWVTQTHKDLFQKFHIGRVCLLLF